MNKTYIISIFIFSMTVVNALEVPSFFADHMVLQQRSEALFWGHAKPNSQVRIKASWGEQGVFQVNGEGKWKGLIQTPEAGGPYNIIIQSGDIEKTLKDVLIGEVWLCSGQSNMEMPLEGWPPNDTIMHSEKTIHEADNPEIRVFTVSKAISTIPEEQCKGTWEVSTPENAGSFSATAYFFGHKLHQELNVPIGLIHSSWGGTPVEAWISKQQLQAFEEFRPVLKNIQNGQSKINELNAWLAQKPVVEVKEKEDKPWQGLNFGDENISDKAFDDQNWPSMELPQLWESTSMGNFDGVIWFRKAITVPEEWKEKDLMLELGPIDDMDITYWNGHQIGDHQKTGHWQTKRKYKIPADLVHEGQHVIAIRVIDHQGGGGIFGDPNEMVVYPADNSNDPISLSGEWKYLPVAEYNNEQFHVFDIASMEYFDRPKLPISIDQNTPSLLYNAMIHPLVPYRIKGVIWYQGESNTGNPEQYDYLFPGLIEDWRDQWKQGDFPFYYVQIAPYDYEPVTRSQRLREAQLKTLKVDNTGMAVTLDIGNPDNIHPANKTAVGERLARWALAKTYGKEIIYSGPIYNGMKIDNGNIVLNFKYPGSGLMTPDDKLRHFMIAGQDREFHPAEATIKADQVVVSSKSVDAPVAVRYAWDNTSDASLFNTEGLPASSFRTDDWD